MADRRIAAVTDIPEDAEGSLVGVRVFSFGYLWHPDPTDVAGVGRCHLVVDLRDLLHNPHRDPAMRQLTGRDVVVRDHVLGTDGAWDILAATVGLTITVWQANRRGGPVTVAFGCAGGRHRSVVLADELHELLTLAGVPTEVQHVDIDRPVWTPVAGERS
jgi:UPF0042 nucleotide-binding protein